MRIICYLSQSQLTLKYMRLFAIIGFLYVFAPAAFAQAADVDAIDLSGKMDTIAVGSADGNLVLGGYLNVGLQNPDNWEDFEIVKVSSSAYSIMRFGGPLIFDTTNNPTMYSDATLYGDFDGDGVGDIIADRGTFFFKGESSYPYFQPGSTSQFATRDKFASFYYPRAIDFDGDGIIDFLVYTDDNSIRLYKGGTSFGTKKYQFADDSVQFPTALSAMTVGKFGAHLKPMVICYGSKKTYLIKQTGGGFSQDSVLILGDSANAGISITNLYAMDITGDGITDLIVSDNYHIYIFRGGDDFGTYPLTPKTAFYTIKSPRLTDITHFGFVNDFGQFLLRACGDLTGSGIPYLAIGGDQSGSGYNKSYAFFYAGGKALDSLYDGIIGYVNNGGPLLLDTLHSINSTGRTVGLINNSEDENFNLRDIDFLMFRNCDSIPHKTNPAMNKAVNTNQEGFEVSCFPAIANKFTKIQITSDRYSETTITVFNLLGQVIQKRMIQLDLGENTEFFNTTDWTNGTYIVNIESLSGNRSTKFLVNH